jgi:predicted ribosome quality control (RQC) complex YloA/Tae2 family protein
MIKMKTDISSLELHYLIGELKVLEGAKIDRIYNSKDNFKELTISCHITGQGKKMLRVILPGIIFLDDTKDNSGTTTGFGMMLRKYLEGGRIRLIAQKDFERVITLIIETRKDSEIQEYFLIIELFSKGNIIFCNDELKILNILEEQAWKDRILKRGETYKYPTSKINTLTISEEDFKKNIESSGKESIVKALAIKLNLGGTYSEELCYISGISKDTILKNITDKEYELLYKNLILLIHKESFPNSEEYNNDISGKGDFEVYPFILESIQINNIKKYDNFSNAIKYFYENVKHISAKKNSGKNLDKIQNIIDEQMKLLKECEEGYAENQAKGELIYEKYIDISNILQAIKDARKEHSWNAIRQKILENPEYRKIIKDIDEKNNSIIVEIEK